MKKSKTMRLKDMFETINNDDEYRRMPYRERRQYGRDAFYKWCGEQFDIGGNSKTGKMMLGVSYKEDDSDFDDDE